MMKHAPSSRGKSGPTHANNAKVRGIQDTFKRAFNLPRFELTEPEANMVSLPQRTEERNELLASLFAEEKPDAVVTIVDAYACVGGDTLSFAKLASDRKFRTEIYAVQKVQPKKDDEGDDKGRFARLEKNIAAFLDGNPVVRLSAKVSAVNMPIQDFIRKKPFSEISLLYLDPPWNLPEGFDLSTNRGTDKKPSPATMLYIDRVQSEIFGPLAAAKAPRPRLIGLKTPTPFIEFSIALFDLAPFTRGYALVKSIPFRDKRGAIRLYYHILKDADEKEAMKTATPAMLNPVAPAFVPGA
jgi:hypothetical protein